MAALLLAVAAPAALAALTPEQATRVGGELGEAARQLGALQESALKVAKAAPGAPAEVAAALGRIAAAPGARSFGGQLGLLALALAAVAALTVAFRALTRRYSEALLCNPQPALGAAGQLGLDCAERAIVALGAYVAVQAWFGGGTLHDLFALGVLWALVRWWLAMLLVEALLRPSRPGFRLIAMSDAAARDVKAIVAVTILVGFAGISLMPVLLRAGLPVPAGQAIALAQGTFVALGCAAALWRYRASRSAPPRAARLWSLFVATGIVLLWPAWAVSVLLLEFSAYHALTWSIRIGALAYVVHALLGLSARGGWPLLAQRSISAAAIMAITIVLTEIWLVEQLALLAPETWATVRRSLIAAAATLFVGYVAWRFLHHWAEERLRASRPGSEGDAAPAASRLTTVLPMLRILGGGAILVCATLLALSQLGVEIGPLLAGAGVVGLAISFGAQTLVRDIITGAFFLVDDAFRVGEYIVSGSYKGTVEEISLRAVKLRHHRGPLYTVPFGELRAIQNLSRDWVIDKLMVGITYDSDIEKARKLVKKIGQQLAEDPAHAPHILEPLKMQGVEEFVEYAIQLRFKMKTRPGQQFAIRRKAYAMIKKAFDENGVKFAFPTVQVAGGANSDSNAAAAQRALGLVQPPSPAS
jgi:small-conductance mechanosensitive channel